MSSNIKVIVIILGILVSFGSIAKSERSASERAAFVRANPSPGSNYQVDHKIPLAAGGSDKPHNMQWLSIQEHKVKTSGERRSCMYGCRK